MWSQEGALAGDGLPWECQILQAETLWALACFSDHGISTLYPAVCARREALEM